MTQPHAYVTDVSICYRSDDSESEYTKKMCVLDLYRPTDVHGFPTIIHFHGGGLIGGGRYVPPALRSRGWAVAATGYRLNPHVQHPAYIEDAAAAVAWVVNNIESLGGDPSRVVISGTSAGAYLAMMIGLDKKYLAAHGIDANRFAALLPISGQMITHQTVRKEQGVLPSDLRPTIDAFAPLYHIRADAPPIFCTTGDWHLDLLCRAQENAYFVAMMKLVGHRDIEHVVIEGVGHDESPPQFWKPSVAFLERVLAWRG